MRNKKNKFVFKTMMVSVVCFNLLALSACAKEYHLKNHKNVPVYFEEEISHELKQLIIDDLALVLQHNKSLEIKKVTHKYKTLQGTKIHKGSYLKYKGAKILPNKINEEFGKIVKKNGKDYLLITKEIVGKYKAIYQQLDYYRGLHQEIKEFVAFMNDIENIDEKDIPAIRDFIYFIGFDDEYVKEVFNKNNEKEQKARMVKNHRNRYYFVPSMIAFSDWGEHFEKLKNKMIVELNCEYEGKIRDGCGLVKDRGKWKLLLIMPGT